MTVVGPQNRPPQEMPQWHIDCFELKLLEKQLVGKNDIKNTLTPFFPLKAGNKSPM